MLIDIKSCAVTHNDKILIPSISWNSGINQSWLFCGPSGTGKSTFARALAGFYEFRPLPGGHCTIPSKDSIAYVSLESAVQLLEEERKNDDSDFVEGGVDTGRNPKTYIFEKTGISVDQGHPLVQMLGIDAILCTGLKYLSTGEIRKTLLCLALLQKVDFLIVDEPFEGLDIKTRNKLSLYLQEKSKQCSIIFIFDGYYSEIPFIKKIQRFEKSQEESHPNAYKNLDSNQDEQKFFLASTSSQNLQSEKNSFVDEEILVNLNKVTVAWSNRKILDSLSWTLKKGEHWRIHGPNGSGKTSLLELITGDNPQVYCNDVTIFGNKRGSGESIWDIKKHLGIVSWKLHTEYRYVKDTKVLDVLISGLRDSIGLYEEGSDEEIRLAKKWLSLAGLNDFQNEKFGSLSYGEQRALLVLRASIKIPKILILDEPCHGLDKEQRAFILNLLEKIAGLGLTTLLHVTHDPDETLSCIYNTLELCPGQIPMYKIWSIAPS